MYELGLVPTKEPFTRLFCQGMVCKWAFRCPEHKWLSENEVVFSEGAKPEDPKAGKCHCKKCGAEVTSEMTKISKTKLNIVDPDKMFDQYGADTVRLYMLSDAPPDRSAIWSETGINGAWRMINRLWRLIQECLPKIGPRGGGKPSTISEEDKVLRRKTHQCVIKVTEAIEEGFQFNTAIAKCNELLSQLKSSKDKVNAWVLRETLETVVKIFSPIIPHFAEERWLQLGYEESIFTTAWPEADLEAAKEESKEIPVRIDGKVKAKIQAPAGLSVEDLGRLALESADVKKALGGRKVKQIIPVPDRIVNIVSMP
jgi:leucyl-tRNA synthetase